jgi:hypothetical protein
MSPYASNLSQSATQSAQNHSSSGHRRASGRKPATRVIRSAGFTQLSAVRLGLESFWDLGVLDRLQAPLTHYHE